MGGRRHRGQRDRARGRRPSWRCCNSQRGLPALRRELPDGPAGRSRARHRADRVVPLQRRVPLPHRTHVHGRRRRVHVGVTSHEVLAADGYRFITAVPSTEADYDRQGHLNNAATVRMFNDLRIAYVESVLGDWWPEALRASANIVAARELHVLYESEAHPEERLVGAMRYAHRTGKAAIVEQRIVEDATGRPVARA